MKTPTDEQLNLAMCEWMGWEYGLYGGIVRWFNTSKGEGKKALGNLPNYLSDDSPRRLLNAAEAKLTKGQRQVFVVHLAEHVGIMETMLDSFTDEDMFAFTSATARQRVVAILQTVKPEIFQ